MNAYAYRMGSVIWRAWIGPGRIGLVHNEPMLLQRNEERVGFRWTMTRRSTREQWSGTDLFPLIQQVWTDLHGETYEIEEATPDGGLYERCRACAP